MTEREPTRNEGMWRRAARDLRTGIDRWPARLFILAVDAAATAAGALWVASLAADAEWWEIALGAVGGTLAGTMLAAMLVFAWHAVRAPFRQRDEARRTAATLYREAHPEFPRHALTISPLWYGDLPNKYEPSGEKRVLFLPIDYTNRESSQRVSLDFELLWRREFKEQVIGPYRVSHYHAIGGGNIATALELPLSVDAQSRAKGELSFDGIGEPWVFEFGELSQVSVNEDFRIDLEITDQVTGATIKYPVPRSRAQP